VCVATVILMSTYVFIIVNSLLSKVPMYDELASCVPLFERRTEQDSNADAQTQKKRASSWFLSDSYVATAMVAIALNSPIYNYSYGLALRVYIIYISSSISFLFSSFAAHSLFLMPVFFGWLTHVYKKNGKNERRRIERGNRKKKEGGGEGGDRSSFKTMNTCRGL